MNDRHIGYAVKSLNLRIGRMIRNIPAVRENGNLTTFQIWILNYLFRNRDRDVFQRDVEAEFDIRRSTATQLLKGMEESGFINRTPVDYDARLKKIVLTESAEEVRKQIQAQIDKAEYHMTSGFTPEELDAFFGYVDRFVRNLEECE